MKISGVAKMFMYLNEYFPIFNFRPFAKNKYCK